MGAGSAPAQLPLEVGSASSDQTSSRAVADPSPSQAPPAFSNAELRVLQHAKMRPDPQRVAQIVVHKVCSLLSEKPINLHDPLLSIGRLSITLNRILGNSEGTAK